MEEDKSLDRLDDEQFPGMIYARMKIYTKDAEDAFPKDLFMGNVGYEDCLL